MSKFQKTIVRLLKVSRSRLALRVLKIFHVLYRPPNLSKSQFLDEFGMFLEGAALSGCENILLGDLNFHLDQHDTWTLKFYDLLEQFSFTQLVNTPTHIQGHILDALCVRDSFSWAISPKVIGGLSDHQAIMFSLIFPQTYFHP